MVAVTLSLSNNGPVHPQDAEIGDSSMPGDFFDAKGTGNSASSKPFQVFPPICFRFIQLERPKRTRSEVRISQNVMRTVKRVQLTRDKCPIFEMIPRDWLETDSSL